MDASLTLPENVVAGPDHSHALRTQLLVAVLKEARVRIAFLESENKHLRSRVTPASDTLAHPTETYPKPEPLVALPPIPEPLQFSVMASVSDQRLDKLLAPIPIHKRLQTEVEVVLATFLPKLRFIRDSLLVTAVEYADRRAFYRALAQLDPTTGRFPNTWKKVKTLDD